MKYYKLKKQSDFEKLFKKGKRAFSSSLTMIYRPSNKTTMGISIGKRHGKSVKRNRIKRLIREAFRSEMALLKKEYAIIFIPKVSEKYEFKVYKNHIRQMIEKDGL